MTAVEFIESVFCDAWTHEDPQHITPDDAAQTMREWAEETSVTVPPTITPLLFSRYWNILCDKHTKE